MEETFATRPSPKNYSWLAVPLREPDKVMRLSRMGSAHQCCLSFMRTLLRRMKRDNWKYECATWNINEKGVGHAVLTLLGPQRSYSLVAFSHELDDALRSDRVIAKAWDATFVLYDGVPSSEDIERLSENVPLQEAGRLSDMELCLSRANRSVRLFNYVIDVLAKGEQPDSQQLAQVGYLMRTTAVYGSGKQGVADREKIYEREEFNGPFQLEMMTVWLIRAFTIALVEHMAFAKGGDKAVKIHSKLRRMLGVGNSTGLGMAPFLTNHPTLINNWILARENALARVRSLPSAAVSKIMLFQEFVDRALVNAQQWRSESEIQQTKLAKLREDLIAFKDFVTQFNFYQPYPWNVLFNWVEQNLSEEGQEQVASLLLEPHVALVEELTTQMAADEIIQPLINGTMTIGAMRELLKEYYDWALSIDFDRPESRNHFWYVSEEKLEPRLGERYQDPGSELELPICVSWHIYQLDRVLSQCQPDQILADFLLANPKFRHIVRRAQQIEKFPYMEIRDNLIGADLLAIDILRLKLSFFGATKFDPRSDRWVRINMFQYAPGPDELPEVCKQDGKNIDGQFDNWRDDWVYPQVSSTR